VIVPVAVAASVPTSVPASVTAVLGGTVMLVPECPPPVSEVVRLVGGTMSTGVMGSSSEKYVLPPGAMGMMKLTVPLIKSELMPV
jgi:hypothetical protein